MGPNVNAVRNEDGWWVNTKIFTEPADHYRKYGYYCPHKWGTSKWFDYWNEQLGYCKNGYRAAGAYITGDHYFYLNFCRIKLVSEEKDKGSRIKAVDKITDFPAFWDGDYNYFHHLKIARYGVEGGYGLSPEEVIKLQLEFYPEQLDGGYHLCVGKARRKGFSYKNAAVVTNRYNTMPDSISIIGAYDKKYLYPNGTMGMFNHYINWLDKQTGWAKSRDVINQIAHKKASYKEKNAKGVEIEDGYMSQVMAVSFGDNVDAARGKDATLVLFEEAGKWPNLLGSIDATLDTLRAGAYTTGQIVVFGTGGDMDKDSIPFSQLFYEPESRDFISYNNIWDEEAYGASCSFFFADYQNKEGFMDEQGNSLKEEAKEYELQKRKEILEKSASTDAHNQRLQEHPFNGSEAFLISGTSGFPVKELKHQHDKVRAEKIFKAGTPYLFTRNKGQVEGTPDLKGQTSPIYDFPLKSADKRGATVIYEPPVDNPPFGLYKIGYDPYQQDLGTSLGAAYVYKAGLKGSYKRHTIVASTVGRAKTSDDMHERVLRLAVWYNAQVMHENMTKDVQNYFRQQNMLRYLSFQPDEVINAAVRKSKVKRIFGIHMNEAIRDMAEKLLVKWLLTVRDHDEEGEPILNLETITDPALLKELIMYHRKGNFDRVDAMLILMLQLEQDTFDKEYTVEDEKENVHNQLTQLAKRQFRKTRRRR